MLLVEGVQILCALNKDLDTTQKWSKERMKQQSRDWRKMKAHSTGWERLSTGSPLLKSLGLESPLEVSIGYLVCTLCKWRGGSTITKSCTRCMPCVNGEDISCHSPRVSIWFSSPKSGWIGLMFLPPDPFSCLRGMDGRTWKSVLSKWHAPGHWQLRTRGNQLVPLRNAHPCLHTAQNKVSVLVLNPLKWVSRLRAFMKPFFGQGRSLSFCSHKAAGIAPLTLKLFKKKQRE